VENANGPTCRRCRADLSLVEAVESRRAFHLGAAATAIGAGRFDDALEELRAADELRHGPDIGRARACTFVLAGDFRSALAEHTATAGAGAS
jgi:hypothetical protein